MSGQAETQALVQRPPINPALLAAVILGVPVAAILERVGGSSRNRDQTCRSCGESIPDGRPGRQCGPCRG
ncbi:MAG: hypothetical protein KF774_17825 [Planctomyces sp.]|nr:hypothetical protein [Planctomyces sp.]